VQEDFTRQEGRNFKKGMKINYPIIDYQKGKDFISFISYATGWRGQIPFMILFNKDGNVEKFYLGMSQIKELENDIKKLK
jgi:hypothetical protein